MISSALAAFGICFSTEVLQMQVTSTSSWLDAISRKVAHGNEVLWQETDQMMGKIGVATNFVAPDGSILKKKINLRACKICQCCVIIELLLLENLSADPD